MTARIVERVRVGLRFVLSRRIGWGRDDPRHPSHGPGRRRPSRKVPRQAAPGSFCRDGAVGPGFVLYEVCQGKEPGQLAARFAGLAQVGVGFVLSRRSPGRFRACSSARVRFVGGFLMTVQGGDLSARGGAGFVLSSRSGGGWGPSTGRVESGGAVHLGVGFVLSGGSDRGLMPLADGPGSSCRVGKLAEGRPRRGVQCGCSARGGGIRIVKERGPSEPLGATGTSNRVDSCKIGRGGVAGACGRGIFGKLWVRPRILAESGEVVAGALLE